MASAILGSAMTTRATSRSKRSNSPLPTTMVMERTEGGSAARAPKRVASSALSANRTETARQDAKTAKNFLAFLASLRETFLVIERLLHMLVAAEDVDHGFW